MTHHEPEPGTSTTVTNFVRMLDERVEISRLVTARRATRSAVGAA